MNAIQQLSSIQPNRVDDYFFQPKRFCHRKWEQIRDPNAGSLAFRIAAAIPLIIATLVSYLIASLGLISRVCFPLEAPAPRAVRQQLPREQWVSPEEQLQRLKAPIANAVDATKTLIPELADLVADYAVDPVLTNWHTALQHLNRLSESIPPLPDDIRTTLESFKSKGLRPLLYFIPGGTLNELEATCRTYWEQKHPGEENPLRFRYISPRVREQYGNVQVEPHWVVMSDDVIPGSKNKTFDQQVASINALNLECEMASLYSTVAAMFLHKIATNESLYQASNDQNGGRWTYTRLRETVDNWRLFVGGFAPSGVDVNLDYDYEYLGVVALRKF